MRLLLTAPQIAARSCEHCREWWYLESGPKAGTITQSGGQDCKRPKHVPVACEDPAQGCPKGHYDKPRNLSPPNMEAYWHFQQARAVGFTPDEQADPIVRRNAAIITQEEQRVDRERQDRLVMLMAGPRA